MAEKLTVKSVERIVAAGREAEVRDAASRGLILRVRASGSWQWTLRRAFEGRDVRIDLGSAWTLDEAREIAEEANRWCRARRNPFSPYGTHRPDFEQWLARKSSIKLGTRVEAKSVLPTPEPRNLPPPSIKWEDAVRDWLEDSSRWLRAATVDSYRRALAVKELDRFKGRMVRDISRTDMAEAVADIHRRGAERQAVATAVNVRSLFGWLGEDERTRRTSVEPRRMSELRTPRKTLVEERGGEGLHVPDRAELRKILRWLRSSDSDALERDLLAGQLLLFTVQRRRTVASARISDFESLGDGTGVWRIPPPHRKKASDAARRGRRVGDHDIPLPPAAWRVVMRAKELAGASQWLFPAVRQRRAGAPMTTMAPDTLTHLFAEITGCKSSPHDVRRGFGTSFRIAAGYRKSDVALILDHGRKSEDEGAEKVTIEHYAFSAGFDPFVITMMSRWANWIEPEESCVEFM